LTGTHDYEIKLDLNVLNHLGINLYSNIPAVLSEVVANSWDADANTVDITFDGESVTIKDDGCGMTKDEINRKFLTVGYQKRQDGSVTTPSGRSVMGRKGIGKLSLFSIANIIEVQSYKDGEKSGCILDVTGIKEAIAQAENYHPVPISHEEIDLNATGTKVIVRDIKTGFNRTPGYLKKRLARRFAIIGAEYGFNVRINGEPISIADREYFHKIQYLWCYGTPADAEWYLDKCNKFGNHVEFENSFEPVIPFQGTEYPIKGWLGTVRLPSDLKDPDADDNLNKIIIVVRGKLAQEDILEEFAEGGIYSDYLIGEINADFLDIDGLDDISTSNRQEIFKYDPRYLLLREWVRRETKKIQSKWSELRNTSGTKDALEIEPIKNWYDTLTADQKRSAQQLFGKINSMRIEGPGAKKEFYKNGIIAFETLKVRSNLGKLDEISLENFEDFIGIFKDQDDIEAALYYQVVEGRIKIIEKFEDLVDEDVIEKTLQGYIYDHLWLLDPSWERGTEDPRFEEQVATEFESVTASLTKSEKLGRVDIRYKEVTGKHVIVELKRHSVPINSSELESQVIKYKNALIKFLEARGEVDPPIEILCIIGKRCIDWPNLTEERKSRRALMERDIRIVYHNELIKKASGAYKKFLQKKVEVRRIQTILRQIDAL